MGRGSNSEKVVGRKKDTGKAESMSARLEIVKDVMAEMKEEQFSIDLDG
jgi:hypothetical protein